jgi:hypothetical protein
MKPSLFCTILFLGILASCENTSHEAKSVKISPYLFGQNLWLTDGAEGRSGYENQLWPKVKESGAKIIRIGGNGYEQSMPGIDTLTRWVNDIKAIGAEPLMQVSRLQTADDAAKLVKYFNVDNSNKIKYWAIGNEPYLIAKWSVDTISKYIKAISTAMKEVDPSIKIFAPDEAAYENQLYDELLFDDKYSVAGRNKNGQWYIDGVTFHNYPNSKNYSRSDVIFYSVSKMRGMIMDLKRDLAKANEKYGRFGDDELLWGLTEFNITYNNPDDLSAEGIAVPSFINGQFWVDIFSLGMEYGAFCVTPWCIQESDRPSTYFGYVGGPPNFTPHSTFYHMKLMSENMSGKYLKLISSNPFIKLFGSKNDGKTTVIIMNQHESISYPIDLTKINIQSEKNSDKINSFSTEYLGDFTGFIAPNSTEVLVFNKEGKLKKHFLYNLDMAIDNQPPSKIK